MKSLRFQLYLIGLIFLLMTTFSTASEGSFSYNSETSESNIIDLYDSSNENNISLIIIVEILENTNISINSIHEDIIIPHHIYKIGEYQFNFTARMVHLVIASGSSHINGTTITPMSNQDSTAAKAEGTYTIEIIDNYIIFASSQSITIVVLSLLGIGIATNKLKIRKNIER